jgi:hypothetical protein
MNDIRTTAEKYEAWLQAVNRVSLAGWRVVSGWLFLSPSGTVHDLSAADLGQLALIERKQLFIVQGS